MRLFGLSKISGIWWYYCFKKYGVCCKVCRTKKLLSLHSQKYFLLLITRNTLQKTFHQCCLQTSYEKVNSRDELTYKMPPPFLEEGFKFLSFKSFQVKENSETDAFYQNKIPYLRYLLSMSNGLISM